MSKGSRKTIAKGKAIAANAAADVRVLVVGNPCNTNCLIAMNNAEGVPCDRFFAMTMLDENRAKTQLAQKAGVDVNEVTNMTIWGNHWARLASTALARSDISPQATLVPMAVPNI